MALGELDYSLTANVLNTATKEEERKRTFGSREVSLQAKLVRGMVQGSLDFWPRGFITPWRHKDPKQDFKHPRTLGPSHLWTLGPLGPSTFWILWTL